MKLQESARNLCDHDANMARSIGPGISTPHWEDGHLGTLGHVSPNRQTEKSKVAPYMHLVLARVSHVARATAWQLVQRGAISLHEANDLAWACESAAGSNYAVCPGSGIANQSSYDGDAELINSRDEKGGAVERMSSGKAVTVWHDNGETLSATRLTLRGLLTSLANSRDGMAASFLAEEIARLPAEEKTKLAKLSSLLAEALAQQA